MPRLTKALAGLVILISITISSSCKKEKDPIYSIEGLWIGAYTSDDVPSQAPQFYAFTIKPGGSLVVESQVGPNHYFGVGSWVLTSDTLKCNYTYLSTPLGNHIAQTTTSIYSNKEGTLSDGVWKDVNDSDPNAGSGAFSLSKVK